MFFVENGQAKQEGRGCSQAFKDRIMKLDGVGGNFEAHSCAMVQRQCARNERTITVEFCSAIISFASAC